jgi:hypothetical protein
LPLGALFSWGESLTAPKNLYWKKTGLTLSWKEHLENAFHHTKSYEDAGIEIKDLNSEEILDIVNEMISRINKTFIDNDDDTIVQNKFWEIGKQSEHFNLREPSSALEYDFIHPFSRIALSYVRNNPDWLKY